MDAYEKLANELALEFELDGIAHLRRLRDRAATLLRFRIAPLVEALEAVEWGINESGYNSACLWCGALVISKSGGFERIVYYVIHDPDCPRQLALAQWTE